MTTQTAQHDKQEDLPAVVADYKKIRAEYEFDDSVFCRDEGRVRLLKYILRECLSDVDRTLIILYIDCHSYRKLGERLGLSHTVVAKEIRRIKAKVLEEYNKRANK